MSQHEEVADLMAENGRLRDAIEKLRTALEKARPYVSELATYSNSGEKHRLLLLEIDRARGIYAPGP